MSNWKTNSQGSGKKRIRHKNPGPLAELLAREILNNNWTYRELAERTKPFAQQRDPTDEGVSWNVIGTIVRGEVTEPQPRTLWLLGLTLGKTLGEMLMAIGYDPHSLSTSPDSAIQSMV